jgi:hypothetical protein
VIHEEGLYVYNMDNIVEKHFSIEVGAGRYSSIKFPIFHANYCVCNFLLLHAISDSLDSFKKDNNICNKILF